MTHTRMVTASTRPKSGIRTRRRGTHSGTRLSPYWVVYAPPLTALLLSCPRPISFSGPGCAGLECTATHNCTCTGPSDPQEWRCYSHLALDSERRWSKASPHPNAYCSESYPGLVSLYTKCMGKAPPAPRPLPPPPPPHGYADANVTLIPVLEAGAKAVGCKSPPQGGAAPCTYAAFRIPGFVNAGGVLLAFAEGRATGCGDFSGYHDMVVRRSTDHGLSWGTYDVIVDARYVWIVASH